MTLPNGLSGLGLAILPVSPPQIASSDESGLITDVGLEFPWSSPTLATVWDWVDALNASAFAGYEDWRLPNVKELQSIIDYGRANQSNPAVDPAFKRRLHRAHL